MRLPPDCHRFDRSAQTAERAKPARPDGDIASDVSCPLPDLPAHVLALVADALALVGLWRTHRPHLRSRLADLLLVDPFDEHFRRRRHLERDARGRLDHDGMGEADALDLELLLEALCDALDHVRDEGAREPVERAVVSALTRPRHDDLVVGLLELHAARNLLRQLAERPVHHHAPRVERNRYAGWNLDRLSSDAAQ